MPPFFHDSVTDERPGGRDAHSRRHRREFPLHGARGFQAGLERPARGRAARSRSHQAHRKPRRLYRQPQERHRKRLLGPHPRLARRQQAHPRSRARGQHHQHQPGAHRGLRGQHRLPGPVPDRPAFHPALRLPRPLRGRGACPGVGLPRAHAPGRAPGTAHLPRGILPGRPVQGRLRRHPRRPAPGGIAGKRHLLLQYLPLPGTHG
ncbi:hypothetical protein DSECCO2_512860 [anaerobic digester metagenome]